MLKKTYTYTDYNGIERTEDFYFNFTEAEVAEMEMTTDGGMIAYLEKTIAANSVREAAEIFKEFILKAYGEKTPDGRRFDKSPEISKHFECSPAYSMLYMEMAIDAKKAAEFFNAVIPTPSEKTKTAGKAKKNG